VSNSHFGLAIPARFTLLPDARYGTLHNASPPPVAWSCTTSSHAPFGGDISDTLSLDALIVIAEQRTVCCRSRQDKSLRKAVSYCRAMDSDSRSLKKIHLYNHHYHHLFTLFIAPITLHTHLKAGDA
jgi:hypothetical protein